MEAGNNGGKISRVSFSRDFPPQFGVLKSPFMEHFAVKRVHHVTRDFPPGCGSNSTKTTQKSSENLSGSERILGFSSNSTDWRRSVPAVRSKPPLGDGIVVKNPQNVKGKAPGLGFDASTERISGEREKVVEMKKSQKITGEREKVLKMVELFRKRCKEISMSGRGIRRIDTAACAELRKEGKISNQSTLMIGAVPGVEVGDKFHYRVELAFVGLHKHYERGIDTMEWGGGRLATCIVASERHLDKLNDPNTLVYIGEGGVLRRNEVGKPPDQELKGGNRALWNNMKEGKPVRVVRGLALDRNYGQKILYVYDGLYEVRACNKKKGQQGNLIFEFQLARCAGQPVVPWQACRRDLEHFVALLCEIANFLGEDSYVDNYVRDFPFMSKILRRNQTSSPRSLPSLYRWLECCLIHGLDFANLNDIPSLARKEGSSAVSWSRKVVSLYSLLSDAKSMEGKLSSGVSCNNASGSSSTPEEKMIPAMVSERSGLQQLDLLPIGVSLPLRHAVDKCRESPPTGWPATACVLLGREDLTLSIVAHLRTSEQLETETNRHLISMSAPYMLHLQPVTIPSTVLDRIVMDTSDDSPIDGMEHLFNSSSQLRYGRDLCLNEGYDEFEEQTCYALEFMGLPLKRDEVESNNWGSNITVGVIDKGVDEDFEPSIYRALSRLPIKQDTFHSCEIPKRLNDHGLSCANLIAAQSKEADFFGVCRGRIRGVVPSCNLHTYAVGCLNCNLRFRECLEMAFKQAIEDKVDIICMPMTLKRLAFRPLTVLDDDIGKIMLEAFKNGILICVPAGNMGPDLGNVGWGIPWCLNVGSCTTGKIGITEVEVGVHTSKTIKEAKRVDGDIQIIGTIQGDSLNIFECPFCPLFIKSKAVDEDCYLSISFKQNSKDYIAYLEKETDPPLEDFHLSRFPQVKIVSKDSKRLCAWRKKYGSMLRVRMFTSKLLDDPRPPFVPDFSSRGPATPYEEILMPNILAPGAAIVTPWTKNLPLHTESTIWSLRADQCIVTGTSCSSALAAGAMSYLVYCRHRIGLDRLGPSALISSVVTTARDLGICKNNNEFGYGAGAINIEKAITPGLLYEETFERMHLYRIGELPVYDLNLPSFAAAFSRSPKRLERVFKRRVTNDDEATDDDPITYESFITIDHNSMDPRVEIGVKPRRLDFYKKGQVKNFELTCQVHPMPRGYISGCLNWIAKKSGESAREVKSRFIFYEYGVLDEPIECEWESPTDEVKPKPSFSKRAKDSSPQGQRKKAKA